MDDEKNKALNEEKIKTNKLKNIARKKCKTKTLIRYRTK